MPVETQQFMTPGEFENQITSALADKAMKPEEPAEPAEKEALEVEGVEENKEVRDEEAEEKAEELAEEEESAKEEPEEKIYEVKVDGETKSVNEEELKKGYQSFQAATKKFMEASEIKKEAEKIKLKAEKIEQNAKAAFNQLLTNPDAILRIIGGNAPDTLHSAFEKYAMQHVSDQELREKDQGLYDATIAHRRQTAEMERQRQEIEYQRRQIEEEKAKIEQKAEKQTIHNTLDVYNKAVPDALKAAGIPKEMINKPWIKSTLKEIVNSSWPENLMLKDLPNLVNECVKELIKDPDIKKMIETSKEETKKEPKKEKKVTVTDPTNYSDKPTFVTPNDFLKRLNG